MSFLLAALASALSALCYAEFAGRIPRAGSAYVYSYITTGEFVAFIIGWNLVLEYVIGAAATTRGLSTYIRFLVQTTFKGSDPLENNPANNNNITSGFISNATRLFDNTTYVDPFDLTRAVGLISEVGRLQCRADIQLVNQFDNFSFDALLTYFKNNLDWLSVVVVISIMILILFGAKDSTNVTLVFTILNLAVVGVILIGGWNLMSIRNWQLKPSEIPDGFGVGGFMPYGWSGVVAGSATCFFGFIGFDTIASSAEEAQNPKKNLPIAILLSLFISFCAYISIGTVQTLVWPYYDQSRDTVLPYIFQQHQMPIVYWFVLFGGLFGLASTELGGMFPLPRIIYSMANDKLIFGYLSKLDDKLRLPARATYIGCGLVALMAAFLNTDELADMVSIGTLAAYTLVSLSVLILRYEDAALMVLKDTDTIGKLEPLNYSSLLDDLRSSATSAIQQQQQRREKVETNLGSSNNLPCCSTNRGTPETVTTFGKQNNICTNKTPLRQSRPLKPQLSVGFGSWFKSTDEKSCPVELRDVVAASGKVARRLDEPSYLQLLTIWRSADPKGRQPGKVSSNLAKLLIGMQLFVSICFSFVVYIVIMLQSSDNHLDGLAVGLIRRHFGSPTVFFQTFGGFLLGLLLLSMLVLLRLPVNQSISDDAFQVPLVPLIPLLSIMVNTFLMISLNSLTWLRFSIWMALGFMIYFGYGIRKSRGYLPYDRSR